MLRHVDGVPHIVLGPMLLAVLTPLERSTGAPRGVLRAILVPFTAYGAAVVVATRDVEAPLPRWLIPLAITANSAAVVVGMAGLTRRRLTLPGRLAGGGLAAGGVRMLLALRDPCP